MKNPSEMTFTTLRGYYYNQVTGRNWVFPIELPDGQFKVWKVLKGEIDSRPRPNRGVEEVQT